MIGKPGIRSFGSYLFLWLITLSVVMVVVREDPLAYGFVLGATHPLPVFLLAGILGAGCLYYLQQVMGQRVLAQPGRRSFLTAITGAILFGGIAIIIDLIFRLPEELNIPFPGSLVFYPTIGVAAEIVFHLLPLTLFLSILINLVEFPRKENSIWIAIVLSASVEPGYQAMFMANRGGIGFVALCVIVFHIFLFSLFELWVFKKYGFIVMYLVRLFYYVVWHIAWGALRLDILYN